MNLDAERQVARPLLRGGIETRRALLASALARLGHLTTLGGTSPRGKVYGDRTLTPPWPICASRSVSRKGGDRPTLGGHRPRLCGEKSREVVTAQLWAIIAQAGKSPPKVGR